jgi:hypothetical protein
MAWHTPRQDLMERALASERAPFTKPDHVSGDRWNEQLKILSTEYKEDTNDAGELIGVMIIQTRVPETSTDPTNVGRVLKIRQAFNWTQFETRAKAGQVTMTEISLRLVASMLLAARIISKREELITNGVGPYLDAGSPHAQKLLGVTLIAQIQEGFDNRGETQQQPQRFAPLA